MDTKTSKRFWDKVKRGSDSECWEWTSAKVGRYGYFSINGKSEYAHRISWESHNGEIPDGIFVCHTCDNPICVNPNHLFLGTAWDNTQDMIKKGRAKVNNGNLSKGRETQIRHGRLFGGLDLAELGRETARKMLAEGRLFGGKRPVPKVTDEQVDEIRRLKNSGMKQSDIARQFEVSEALVSRIVKGERRA